MAKKKEDAARSTPEKDVLSSAVEESTVKKTGLPLFFQKPAALEKTRHANASLFTGTDLRFAKLTNSVSLNVLEFLEASKFYPIVFTTAEVPAALAILGLEQENYYVDSAGQWRSDHYIPAYIRQYPFIFFEKQEDKKFYLCVDEKSPHFRANGAEGTTRLFNEDGTPSAMVNQALEFCSSYYKHHAITNNFTKDLKKHNLLSPYHSQVTLTSGRKISLSGFMMIDELAFNSLPQEVFLEFRTKGWLPFIYLALSSASNWKRLASLAESQPIAAAQ